ncbi:MAG: FecR domain-containing protein [Rhodospirillales bacterium]|nr:FecR domain-containing protein [Rhodospirillales bacterium]
MDGNPRFGPDAPEVDLIEIAQAVTGEPIGQIDTAKGDAVIIRADGETVTAEAGTSVFLGDVIETSGDGSVGLIFIDDTTFSLAEDGRMTIDELVYDPTTNEGSSVFNVAKGVFTFVSGEIAKTSVDAMKIETSAATIGIRGTAGGGRVINPQADDPNSPLPPSGTFSNFRDPVTGQAGEMNISTPTGSQTLNGVNATTSVPNPFVPPSTPVVLPASALQAVFGSSIAALPTPPSQQGAGEDGENIGDTLTTGDAPEGAGAAAEAETAAADAFAQALADGVDPVAALEIAAQTAQLTISRFGLDPTQLDTFTVQNAIDDVISGITNTIVGDPTALISGGGLATYSALIGAQTGNEVIDQAVQQVVQQVAQTIGQNINEQILAAVGDTTDNVPQVDISDVTIAHSVSGTETVTLTNGANDVITGSASADTITLMGGGASQGGGGDIVDLAGGTDTLILNSTTNTLAFSNVETLQLAYNSTSDITSVQSLTWQTAGSLTMANQDASTSGPRAPFAFLGNATNQNLTLSFQMGNTNASNSSIDLGGGSDSVTLAAGTNTIASAANVESWLLSAGTNTFTLSPSSSGASITGSTGADTVSINSADGTTSASLGGGNDVLAVNGMSSAPTFDGGADTDTFRLTSAASLADANFANFSNFESFQFGADATYSITAGGNFNTAFNSSGIAVGFASGITSATVSFDGSSLTNALTYSGSANTGGDTVTGTTGADTILTGNGADSITTSGGGDTITAGGGADSITLGSGSDHVNIDATSEFGDTISAFTAGGGGDIIDFNATVSRGTSTVFEALATGGTVQANTAVVSYTTDVAAYTTAATVATALNNLTGLSAGNTMLFAVGNGTDSRLWYWADGQVTADGTVESGELSQVADLSSVNNDNLTAANFDGFS